MINVVVEADIRPQIRRPTPDKEAGFRPLHSVTCKFSLFFQCQLTYHKLSQTLHIFMCIALAVEELDR